MTGSIPCAQVNGTLILILSRGSVEVKTPPFPCESFPLYDMLSPTDGVPPADCWSTDQSTADARTEEVLPPKRLLNHEDDAYPPTGGLAFATHPPSHSECSINSTSSKDTREYDISPAIGSRNEEEEPSYPVSQFSPPKHEREICRTSLVLRPVSSGGPAPQVLHPPPVTVRCPPRSAVARPLPTPRRQSHQSIGHSQVLCESPHDVCQPGSATSLTSEEGLTQLPAWTRQTDSALPLGYTGGFKRVRGRDSRALPTPPRPSARPIRPLPPLPITAPVNVRHNNWNRSDTQS
jgi:hypothetical protein